MLKATCPDYMASMLDSRKNRNFISYREFVEGLMFSRIFTFWLDEYASFRDVGVWLFFWDCWWGPTE